MPYDRRLGDLREEANQLLDKLVTAKDTINRAPLQLELARKEVRRLETQLRIDTEFFRTEKPRLDRLEQEILRLEREQGRVVSSPSGLTELPPHYHGVPPRFSPPPPSSDTAPFPPGYPYPTRSELRRERR